MLFTTHEAMFVNGHCIAWCSLRGLAYEAKHWRMDEALELGWCFWGFAAAMYIVMPMRYFECVTKMNPA